MWVTKAFYAALTTSLERYIGAEAKAATLAEQNKVLQVNLDWMRTRVSQLERERAQLLYRFTDVKIETPEFDVSLPAPKPDEIVSALSGMFSDIGDERAASLRILHNPDGTVAGQSE